MNECGVVNIDCYDTEGREECTKAGLGINIDIVDLSSPSQQAASLSARRDESRAELWS